MGNNKGKSYYDWEMEHKAKKRESNSIGVCNDTFKEKCKIERENIEKASRKDEETTKLGLKRSEFKEYLSKWEEKNLL